MIVAIDYLPPAAIVIVVEQPETKQQPGLPKLPLLVAQKPPIKDGPGGRTSGGSR